MYDLQIPQVLRPIGLMLKITVPIPAPITGQQNKLILAVNIQHQVLIHHQGATGRPQKHELHQHLKVIVLRQHEAARQEVVVLLRGAIVHLHEAPAQEVVAAPEVVLAHHHQAREVVVEEDRQSYIL